LDYRGDKLEKRKKMRFFSRLVGEEPQLKTRQRRKEGIIRHFVAIAIETNTKHLNGGPNWSSIKKSIVSTWKML
jgi:hypothetical protein